MIAQHHRWQNCSFEYVADVSPDEDEKIVWRDSESSLVISRIGSSYRLRPGDWMFVDVLDECGFESRAQIGTPIANCEHFLADQVIPRVIAHQGSLVLHAGAIAVGNKALLMLGASGRGKSTLAASFATDGYSLIGDDAIIINSTRAGPYAAPVYPSLRLFPDSVAAVLPSNTLGKPMANYSEKLRITLPQVAVAELPVCAAFLLESESDGASINVRRTSTAEACMSFVRNSFALDPGNTKLARKRLEHASELANAIPVFRLAYPRIFSRLAEVRQAILGHVAA